jgi:hypothetical protein
MKFLRFDMTSGSITEERIQSRFWFSGPGHPKEIHKKINNLLI